MSIEGHDADGRFSAGNHPVTGFHTNPERRNKFPTRGRSFELAASKYLAMTDTEIKETTEKAANGKLSQAEQLALQLISQAKDTNNPKHLEALKSLLDRAEGKPRVSTEAPIEHVPQPIVLHFA